jgi:hypothetical protein
VLVATLQSRLVPCNVYLVALPAVTEVQIANNRGPLALDELGVQIPLFECGSNLSV